MDVPTVGQYSAATGTAEVTSDSASKSSGDFDTFLRLLTTQAQNQDPFNPVDATEYASQLASFSAVEQQVMTNELLSEIASRANGSGLERMASWIGLETLVPGAGYFDGSPVTLFAEVPDDADSAVLVLRDAEGVLQNRVPLLAGTGSYVWDGTDMAGGKMSDGVFGAELEISKGGVLLEMRPVSSYMRIDEVMRDEEGFVLTLRGGGMIDAAEVLALRRPVQ